ncbi:MAG TPA: SRPBCC family protein [Acidimicrobiales bacterium]
MTEPLRGSESIHVDAPPEAVWDIVSDITNMGKWSPECTSAGWIGGATGPAAGARFRGRNKSRWMRWPGTCEVTLAERGNEFTFVRKAPGNLDGGTTWRYTFEPEDAGTRVTESFEQAKTPPAVAVFLGRVTLGVGDSRQQVMMDGVRTTLQRVKAAAEAS